MTSWGGIVVGAGTAGIPAAVFAAERGRRVLLVEKTADIGGTLHVSGGHMSAAGTRRQQEQGIEDTPAEHVADIIRMSHGQCDRELTELAVTEAAATIDWLDSLGFDFDPTCPALSYSNVHEPYSKPRLYWGVEQGRSLLRVLRPLLEEAVKAGAIDLRLRSEVRRLLVDDVRVSGVELLGPNGSETYRAPTVVLTSGGYTSNPNMFEQRTHSRLVSAGMPSSTGDGIRMAEELGAEFRFGDRYLPTFGGIEDPNRPHVALDPEEWPILVPQQRLPWEVFVNAAGDRFLREDEPDVAIRERAALEQPDQVFWVIFDQHILEESPSLVPGWGADGLAARAAAGSYVHRAAMLRDLGGRAGVDAAKLERTVDTYNRAVDAGVDPLGREHLPARIETPPFYAVENHATTLRTPGGLRINADLEVMRVDGSPIPGLYAAGEVIGGATFGGTGYAAGMSVTPALSFGRLLGSGVI